MSITTLAFKIVADTSQFTSGMVMTRKELSAARNLFNETRTPVEQYQAALQGLQQLQGKGLNADVVQRSVRKLREEFWGLNQTLEETKTPIDNLFAKIAGGVALGNLVERGFRSLFRMLRMGVSALASNIATEFEKALDFGQLSRKLKLDPATLGGLSVIGERLGMDLEEAAKKFVESGRDMSRAFGMTARDLQEATNEARKLGLVLDESRLFDIEQANAAISKMAEEWQKVGKTLAGEVAPALQLLAEAAQTMLKGLQDVTQSVQSFSQANPNVSGGIRSGLMMGLGSGLGVMAPAMQAGAYAGSQFGGAVQDVRAANESARRAREMQDERDRLNAEQGKKAAAINDKLFQMLNPKDALPERSSMAFFQQGKRELAEQQKLREKAREEGQRATEKYATPREQAISEMGDMLRMLRSGSITGATFQRALNAEAKKLADADKTSPAGANTALTKGSLAAVASERELLRYNQDAERRTERREAEKRTILLNIERNTARSSSAVTEVDL
jgi:hypothetical protein